MNLAAARTGAWRHVFLTLAALAVMLKVLVPPGFMAAAEPRASFPLVLCTDHGAVTVDAGDLGSHPGKKVPAGKPAHDAPCAFAGHALAAPAPEAEGVRLAAPAFAATQAHAPIPAGLTPGRGLAAPPPPSRGPPQALV